jgi:RHS repeat-associated protein
MNVTYDSRNRVVRRVSPNGTLNLTYSGWNLIEERDASGTLEQTYVHGAGTDELLVKITASGPAYYHHDGLGSTIALTGENGELLESYRYDAFGAATILSPSTLDPRPSTAFSNRFLFTGREWLGQAGIYDYRNRVYSAQIGRFLQTDPIRFEAGDVNLYRYVGNGPVNWVDPEGLWQLTGSAGAGIGMTITIGYNAGQLNFGSYVGFGFGASLRWQPEDSGCQHMEGAFPETRLSASLPLWGAMAIPLSSTYNNGAYVVDGVLMGYKSLISNEEQIFKRCARF